MLCQLGLQFFPDRPLALREMLRVLAPRGRLALSVYGAIERTPAAHAFVEALDRRFGPEASRIKRAEHILPDPDAVGALIAQQGFGDVSVHTVTKTISFPSVRDYVRFQLLAMPMASLLGALSLDERNAAIEAVAAGTAAPVAPEMTRDGRLSFPLEAHVALARKAG